MEMKYKKVWSSLGIAVLLAGAFFTGHSAGAASKTPGSTGDPLITLSYLEERLAATGVSTGAEKVQLGKGRKLVGETGTGIVLLGGSVTATGNGVADLTEGRLAEADTSLFLYHSYVVTEDGSGCEALSTCTVLVTGEYVIK